MPPEPVNCRLIHHRGAEQMSLRSLFRRSTRSAAVHDAYAVVVQQARDSRFFGELEVPDTVDGRFEMVALHAFLVLRRLKGGSRETSDFGQALFDVMFEDMDVSLREMGAGDMGVGKRVKAMVQAFYGRVAAYEAGLANGSDALEEALRRNVYRGVEPGDASVRALAGYIDRQDRHLSTVAPDDIVAGRYAFA
jgi:cytochrome b pre-mRNA-processing protein 3